MPSWFATPETWEIYQAPLEGIKQYGVLDLRRLVRKLHRWLKQWLERGSNPFIHRTRFPRYIQDAYTTLSSYFHKTVSNEQIVLKIIEDRVTRLLLENSDTDPAALDPLEHIARVQALLVYQVLGFYDGDVRLRCLAEIHIPVLYDWMRQVVERASRATCLGSCVVSSTNQHMKSYSIYQILITTKISFGSRGYSPRVSDAPGSSPLVSKHYT